MKTLIFLTALLLVSGIAGSQTRPLTMPEMMQKQREESNRKRQEALDRKEKQNNQAGMTKTVSEYAAEIDRLKIEIAALKKQNEQLREICKQHNFDLSVIDDKSSTQTEPLGSLAVGKVGVIQSPNSLKILQILDSTNMICEFTRIVYVERITESPSYPQESRTASGRYAPIKYTEPASREEVVWIKGIDTTGKVDDHIITIKLTLRVTGTTQYDTAFGPKTVFVLEPTAESKPKTEADRK